MYHNFYTEDLAVVDLRIDILAIVNLFNGFLIKITWGNFILNYGKWGEHSEG